MSELRGRRGLPAMSAVDGDVRAAADAGASGRCLAREMQAIPLAEAARPRRVPGLASAPPLHDPPGLLAIGERMLHHYLTHSPRMPGRVMRDIEERRRLFVEGCRAREAAFDAEPPELRPDALAFALALAAQDARGPPGDRARAGRGAAAGTGRGCGSEATIGAGGARGEQKHRPGTAHRGRGADPRQPQDARPGGAGGVRWGGCRAGGGQVPRGPSTHLLRPLPRDCLPSHLLHRLQTCPASRRSPGNGTPRGRCGSAEGSQCHRFCASVCLSVFSEAR